MSQGIFHLPHNCVCLFPFISLHLHSGTKHTHTPLLPTHTNKKQIYDRIQDGERIIAQKNHKSFRVFWGWGSGHLACFYFMHTHTDTLVHADPPLPSRKHLKEIQEITIENLKCAKLWITFNSITCHLTMNFKGELRLMQISSFHEPSMKDFLKMVKVVFFSTNGNIPFSKGCLYIFLLYNSFLNGIIYIQGANIGSWEVKKIFMTKDRYTCSP